MAKPYGLGFDHGRREPGDVIKRFPIGRICPTDKKSPHAQELERIPQRFVDFCDKNALWRLELARHAGKPNETRRQKLNIPIKSPIAGLFVGKYGADGDDIGLGRLSRLRVDSGLKFQFFSMNFTIDA